MSLKHLIWFIAGLMVIMLSAGFGSHRTEDYGSPRTVSGTVTDEHASPIPEAAVQMENEKTLTVRTCITEAHGQFHFEELNPDADYDLQAVFDGVRGPKKIVSQFDSRHNVTVKLVIRIPGSKYQ